MLYGFWNIFLNWNPTYCSWIMRLTYLRKYKNHMTHNRKSDFNFFFKFWNPDDIFAISSVYIGDRPLVFWNFMSHFTHKFIKSGSVEVLLDFDILSPPPPTISYFNKARRNRPIWRFPFSSCRGSYAPPSPTNSW